MERQSFRLRKFCCRLGSTLLLMLFLPCASIAGPARPALESLTQPDGSLISVRQFGDEWGNGLRTASGHTILHDERSGFWVYAEPAPFGGLRKSSRIVGRDSAVDIPPRLAGESSRRSSGAGAALSQLTQSALPSLGNQPILVIFVDFTPTVRVGTTAMSLANRFFGPSDSVRDYYGEVSYGALNLIPAAEAEASLGGAVNDGIVAVQLPYAHPDSATLIDDRNRQIVQDALIAVDPYVDFSQFDSDGDGVISAAELHILVVVAGYERSYSSSPCGASVWGHHWALFGAVAAPVLDGVEVGRDYAQVGEWHCAQSNQPGHPATIGVIVHELGHNLGLPDLYDTDQSSEGAGRWSLMASGTWNLVNLDGDSPAHPDPWSKFALGWVSPTKVSSTLVSEAIGQAASQADVYQLLDGTADGGEYFLIENRQRAGYDAGLPGHGLLIWHIDAGQPSNNNECYPGGPSCADAHYKVSLVQADGQDGLERNDNDGDSGDPWPGDSGNRSFYQGSSPASWLHNGNPSGVSVFAISDSAAVMTAVFGVAGSVPLDTFIASQPPALANSTTASFFFYANEPDSGFECRLDSAPFTPCVSSKIYGSLADGSHDFAVRARDSGGAVDPTPATYSWTIDSRAPDTNITSGPNGTIVVRTADFHWTGSDNLTPPANLLYAHRLDPIEPSFSTYGAATTVAYSNLANGSYTLHVKAKDQAGNQDPTPATQSFAVNIDNTAPILTIASHVNNQKVNIGSIILSGTASDAGMGDNGISSVTVNGQSAAGGSAVGSAAANWSHSVTLNPGANLITVVATDNSANQNQSTVQITLNFQPIPAVSINHVAVSEGHAALSNAVFIVTLSAPSSEIVAVNFATANGSASAGSDYVARSGTVTFDPGETLKTIAVSVNGDTALEPDETFLVNLTSATNATIANGQGVGTIVNDDVSLAVTRFQPTPSGFDVDFNKPIDASVLNIYDTEGQQFGPPDVTLVGQTIGAVRGSLIVDGAAGAMTFVRTGGVLSPDTYTVKLRSAANGFKETAGSLLDGDGDGVPGGDFVTSFTVTPSSTVTVGIPDFTVGPGQPVNVPFDRSGLPIVLTGGSDVTAVEFTLLYNPALLTISAVSPGAALPTNATVQVINSAAGALRLRIDAPTRIGASPIELARLVALVPDSAVYRTAQVISLEIVSLVPANLSSAAADTTHVVAYLGDTTGNGAYSALDGQRVLRVAVGLDSGFAAYPLIDPVLIADTTWNGSISSLDATRILQEVVGIDRPEIQPIPAK